MDDCDHNENEQRREEWENLWKVGMHSRYFRTLSSLYSGKFEAKLTHHSYIFLKEKN